MLACVFLGRYFNWPINGEMCILHKPRETIILFDSLNSASYYTCIYRIQVKFAVLYTERHSMLLTDHSPHLAHASRQEQSALPHSAMPMYR